MTFGTQTNAELNCDLRVRYLGYTEYGTEAQSQSSIFGTQTNMELNFDLTAEYLVRILCKILISELDIR